MHKCIIVAPPARATFARVSSFTSSSSSSSPPRDSIESRQINFASVSAFHYRVYSHGTREHASERTRDARQKAISRAIFSPRLYRASTSFVTLSLSLSLSVQSLLFPVLHSFLLIPSSPIFFSLSLFFFYFERTRFGRFVVKRDFRKHSYTFMK